MVYHTRNLENALNNSPMSDDDDAIEPLFDSEVEFEFEFESLVIRRKRINATLKSSAH